MKTPLFAFTLSMIMCMGARAELKWETTAVELHPALADKQAVGHFKYQNTGKTPVHFKSVHASCGCTTAQTQKEVVQPGEKGEITATFTFGDRTGTQIKTVRVDTDEAANQKTVLTLKAVIPTQLEISPTFVFWKQGDKPDPKQISVKVGKDFTVKNIKVTSSTPNFQTKVKDTGKGEFKIDVTPQDTNKPGNSKLTIQAEDSQKTFYATARIASTEIAPGGALRYENGRIVAPDGSVIPQQLEISPTFVFWKQGDKPDLKQISVKVGKDFTVKHIKVTSSTPNFQTKVKDTGKGEFKIDVTPQDTNKPGNSKLTIQAEDSQKTFYATARIASNGPIAPGGPLRYENGRIVAPDGSSEPVPTPPSDQPH